ncbi:MAG: DNA gyrase C-terminal beta-propeller domain-containing protein [Caldilineaceae bacterium]
MTPTRPDLNGLPDEVLAYIAELEGQVEALSARGSRAPRAARPTDDDESFEGDDTPVEPSEPPTTSNVITISAAGFAKRTPRHFYGRQRRGGMGVFDIETSGADQPAFLVVADVSASLILLTDQGRAFRAAVADLPEAPVRARGASLFDKLPLRPDEHLRLALPDLAGAFLCLVSERGQVRRIAANYLGRNLNPGAILHDVKDGGPPAAACWSSGNDDLVIVTRKGTAIRFTERQVPVRGCLGLRVDPGDRVAGVVAQHADGALFVLADDGKGAVRFLKTFAANKAPGSGGKALMKTDELVAALPAGPTIDLFAISRLGKIIRFRADDVPPKEGPVQGVNCMALRADTCVAAAAIHIAP